MLDAEIILADSECSWSPLAKGFVHQNSFIEGGGYPPTIFYRTEPRHKNNSKTWPLPFLQLLDNHSSYPHKSYRFGKLLIFSIDANNRLLAIASLINSQSPKRYARTGKRKISSLYLPVSTSLWSWPWLDKYAGCGDKSCRFGMLLISSSEEVCPPKLVHWEWGLSRYHFLRYRTATQK